ncbi:MAG: Choline-sulfatase [Verrucomicrobiales bacterium]|nr:Choline-sulfatase [Verrucomicrobiales bacterium]
MFLRPLLLVLLGTQTISCVSAADAAKPNIIVILADDVGFGDLGCYGATLVKTHALDRLAAEGCRFTDAHSPAATCTPTRRALLTGGYSWRQEAGSSIAPGDAPITIQPGTVTLPSLLKQAGYRTGIVGKWHLGLGGQGGPDWNGEIKPSPLDIGFDSSFIMAATGDRVPCVFIDQRRVANLDPADPITVSYKNKIGTDPTGAENPELLKLKHTLGHDRTIVNGVGRIGWMSGGKAARWRDEDMADTFAAQAIKFLETPGDAPFFLLFTPHGIHVPRVPNERFVGSSPLGARGDAIQELDDTVSRVLAAVEKKGQSANTLVIFTSDNGGVWDDGYADHGPQGTHRINGALRGTKGTLFEGGHRVPFIARWPGKIKPGTESSALISSVDFPATFAALTNVPLPADAAPDSFNILPALTGESTTARTSAFFHVGGTQGPLALRMGSWKYIQAGRGGSGKAAAPDAGDAPKPKLYDLGKDPAETHDLAAELPDKLREMAAFTQAARAGSRTRP